MASVSQEREEDGGIISKNKEFKYRNRFGNKFISVEGILRSSRKSLINV